MNLPGIDLAKFAQKVYELSVPKGLGFLHSTPAPLSREEAEKMIQPTGRIALSMDYVAGRCCKMTVFRDPEGNLSTRDSWYDHTDKQFAALLAAFGLAPPEAAQHGVACECEVCGKKTLTSAHRS